MNPIGSGTLTEIKTALESRIGTLLKKLENAFEKGKVQTFLQILAKIQVYQVVTIKCPSNNGTEKKVIMKLTQEGIKIFFPPEGFTPDELNCKLWFVEKLQPAIICGTGTAENILQYLREIMQT